jgi:catalase
MTAEQLAAKKRAKRDKLRYVKLRHKGALGSCTATPREAEAMMADDPDLTGEDVWMTQDEFEALPEFGGW